MNRIGFLRKLEELLRDIPDNERRDAMEYYRNYFDDAGPENEEKIIEELGSPWKVAESIKKDLFGDAYRAEDFVKPEQSAGGGDKTARNVLIAVLLVATFPFWIAIVAAAFGLLLGALGCLLGLAVCVVAFVGVFFLAGVILAGAGMIKVFTGFPAVGLVLIGIGLLLLAFGILGLLFTVWAIGRALPWMLRGIVSLCQKPFQRGGASI